jgi:hypothetical protein
MDRETFVSLRRWDKTILNFAAAPDNENGNERQRKETVTDLD